ncbi:Monocarboxylate transporter 12-B-like 2 [Homarus americanus]|uniref:Monocarboxylate transporter 12-B-like 2 n=1 Tax=Homarus americanus TaxID=6706 RepID=A0A8J5MY77_HOMAM|nr:Monocarboxylate transporter 12-B-like 2 [Homarus americanus]
MASHSQEMTLTHNDPRHNARSSCDENNGIVEDNDKVHQPVREQETEKDKEESGIICWGVAGGTFIIMVMINMVGSCFSFIFSPLLLELETTSVFISWIFNILQCIWSLSGQFLTPLLEEYSWRKVALVCSVFTFWSIVLSAFATSAWFLLFSYSILTGLSCGMLSAICFLIIPFSFTRRRGLANASMMAGTCLGQMIGPVLIVFLQEKFAFFGATLLLGAIMLNCCVGASLLCPRKAQVKLNKGVHTDDPMVESSGSDNAAKRRICSISNNVFLRVCRNSVINLSILKSPRAVVIAVGGMLTLNCWLNFLSLMPFAIQAAGHPLQAASMYMTVSAVFNLGVRLTVSMLSDFSWFSMRACYMTSTAVIVISTIAFSVVDDIKWQMVAMAGWGCGVGGYMGLFNLIMVHYMGLDKMAPTMGATLVLIGFGSISIGPIVGMMRDVTGSYAVSMWVLAGLAACCFLLWIFMPAAVRYDRNKFLKSCPSNHAVQCNNASFNGSPEESLPHPTPPEVSTLHSISES